MNEPEILYAVGERRPPAQPSEIEQLRAKLHALNQLCAMKDAELQQAHMREDRLRQTLQPNSVLNS